MTKRATNVLFKPNRRFHFVIRREATDYPATVNIKSVVAHFKPGDGSREQWQVVGWKRLSARRFALVVRAARLNIDTAFETKIVEPDEPAPEEKLAPVDEEAYLVTGELEITIVDVVDDEIVEEIDIVGVDFDPCDP